MSDWNAGEGESPSTAGSDVVSAGLEMRTRTDLLEMARARHVPDADLMRRDELIAVLGKSSGSGTAAGGSATKTSDALEGLSRGELLQVAQARNISGAGAMSRAALVAALATRAVRSPATSTPASRDAQPPEADASHTHSRRQERPSDSALVPGVIAGAVAGQAAHSSGSVGATSRRPASPPSPATDAGRKRAKADSLPPRRVLIPGVILCVALLGVGLAAGSKVGGTAAATGHTSVYTTTVSGRIVTVKGKAKKVIVPARTIRRNGKTVTIPAHTVAITDTQVLPGPVSTVDGTVFRTVKVPVTVTGPGRTDTTTQTVSGPVTTVVQTVVSTDVETSIVTVTQTVTEPPVT